MFYLTFWLDYNDFEAINCMNLFFKALHYHTSSWLSNFYVNEGNFLALEWLDNSIGVMYSFSNSLS